MKKTTLLQAETLDCMSEAFVFNKWMYSAISGGHVSGKILEIGSGIGNISQFLLDDCNDVFLSDINFTHCAKLSIRFVDKRSLKQVQHIDIGSPFFNTKYRHNKYRYNTVVMLNVLEHIQDDALAIQNCHKLLKPGGRLTILVPSYQKLYCDIDKGLGHYRRYSKTSLTKILEENNFGIKKMFRFNSLGVFGWLLFGKLLKHKKLNVHSIRVYNKLVHVSRLLDIFLLRKFGLSLIVYATKK